MGYDAKLCPLCGAEMTPPRCARYLTMVEDPELSIMEQRMEVLVYTCPRCRYVAMFAPPSPLEEFEREQALLETLSPVGKFEYTFRGYSEKQLQRVIDGKDYVPEAKKAAKNLLYRRKYGE